MSENEPWQPVTEIDIRTSKRLRQDGVHVASDTAFLVAVSDGNGEIIFHEFPSEASLARYLYTLNREPFKTLFISVRKGFDENGLEIVGRLQTLIDEIDQEGLPILH